MKKIYEIIKKKKSKLSKPAIFTLFLVLILFLLFFLIGSKSEKLKANKLQNIKKELPINIIVMPLKKTTIYDRINLAAETKAWEDLKLQSQVAGEVIKKKIKVGKFVEKGDVLILINSKKYKSVFNSSKATYNSALSKFNRIQNLYKKNIAKKSDFDDAKALMEQAKASMEIAKIDLNNCKIKAPIAGFINQIFVEKGEIVAPGSFVTQILNTKKIKIRVGIPEGDITLIKNVKNFVVEIEALGKKQFSAKKYFLSQSTGEKIRLYALELEIQNPKGEILSDMFVRVDIIKKTVKNCIAIPVSAIINKGKNKIAYIEKDGKAYEKKIELGIQEGFMFEITKGLKATDNLIIMGQHNLSDKQIVKITKKIENLDELN